MMFLKGLFGGGSSIIYILLLAGAGGIYWEYTRTKAQNVELKGDIEQLEGTIESKDGIIASLGRTAGRRDAQDNQSKDLGNDILQAKDGTHCVSSKPIRVALDGLRLNSREGTPDATNKALPVLAGADTADTD